MADKKPGHLEKRLQSNPELDGELTFALVISYPSGELKTLRVYRNDRHAATIKPDSIEKCVLWGRGGSVPERPPGSVPCARARELILTDEHVASIYARMILAHMFAPCEWRSPPEGQTEEPP